MASESQNNHILVIGGAGYIGAHACKALKKAGYLPVVYDNLSRGHAYAIKWGPFVHADVKNQEKLIETLDLFKPQAVLHFAAFASVFESVENPGLYYENNLAGTLSLLEAMRKTETKYLVFSSTCATYGHPKSIPMTEEHPQMPISPYGKSKWMVELILEDYKKAYPFHFLSLRYFNVAGADPTCEIGENHTPETHLLPSILQVCLGIKKEIVVYGSDFPTKDGSAIRDYLHVQDLAEAHVLGLNWLLKNKTSTAVNLGTGIGYSVFELIRAVAQHTGIEVPVRIEEKREGEPAILTADFKRAKELFGWSPEYSDLKTLIETSFRWHKLLAEHAPIVKECLTRMAHS